MAWRWIGLILMLIALTLSGCSAITLHQEMATATAEASVLATAATDNPTVDALQGAHSRASGDGRGLFRRRDAGRRHHSCA